MSKPDVVLPSIQLPSTQGAPVTLAEEKGTVVLFVYPRTSPLQGPPEGWEDIPGACGCTAESCSFRDLSPEFARLGVHIFGLSSQSTAYQREAHERLHLTYPLLSDDKLAMLKPAGLATFSFGGVSLYRRTTLVLRRGWIVHRFDDIRDPAEHPADVLRWVVGDSSMVGDR